MAALLTLSEIEKLAFSRQVEISLTDKDIEAIQLDKLKPILGEDFYNEVVASPSTFSTLLTYIKPFISYCVKLQVLPVVFIQLSTTGANKVQGNNRNAANTEEYGIVEEQTRKMIILHSGLLTTYLNDNEASYSNYKKGSNLANQVEILGGIIFEKKVTDNDDDYFIND